MTKAAEVVNKKMVTSDRDSVLRTDFHFLFSLRNEAYQYISQDEINRTLQEVSKALVYKRHGRFSNGSKENTSCGRPKYKNCKTVK